MRAAHEQLAAEQPLIPVAGIVTGRCAESANVAVAVAPVNLNPQHARDQQAKQKSKRKKNPVRIVVSGQHGILEHERV